MRAKFVNESNFERGKDPLRALGLGVNLYQQYLDVLDKNPDLKNYWNGKQVFFFKEDPNNPREIWVNFNKEHPMSGYGGRTSWMRFWGTIKYIKGKYRVKCYMVEDSGKSDKYFGEFPTMEEAVKFVIPDFQGILSYYSEWSGEKE